LILGLEHVRYATISFQANDEDDAKGADKDIVDDWMSMMKKTLGRGRVVIARILMNKTTYTTIGKAPEPWGSYTLRGTGPLGPSADMSYT